MAFLGLVALLAHAAAGLAAESAAVKIPEAAAALGQPVPGDPLDLLGTARLLSAAGLKEEAEATTLLAERGVLLRMTGAQSPSGETLALAIERLPGRAPSDDELRDRVLSAVRVELPPALAGAAPSKHAGRMPSGLPAGGGPWTTQIHVYENVVRVPVRIEYAGAAGQIGGIAARLQLVPLRQGRTITLEVIDRGFSNARWRHGEAFWINALATRPQRVPAAEVIDAIQGLADRTYRLEASVDALWLTSSDDPRSPLLIVGKGRVAAWHDPFDRVPMPVFDRGRAAAVMQSRTPQARCIAGAAARESTETSVPAVAQQGARAAPPVPLDSPLMRRALERAVPVRPQQLLDTVALLEAARHPEEAGRLAAAIERALLLELLGRPFEPRGNVAALVAAPAPDQPPLAALRSCVMSSAIGVEAMLNPDQVPGAGFAPPFAREVGNVWSRDAGGGRALFVPLQVANLTPAWLTRVEFTARLVPAAGGEPVAMLLVSRTGGEPMEPGQRKVVAAMLDPRSPAMDAAALDALGQSLRRGELRLEPTEWSLDFGTDTRFRLTQTMLAWIGPETREASARRLLMAASCADTASCFTRRSGKGLFNPLLWIGAECVLAIGFGVLFARRLRARPWLGIAYIAYTLLALGATGLIAVDRPTGSGYDGMISVGATFMLGLPWTLIAYPLAYSALSALFTSPDVDLVFPWIGIAINHLLLALLLLRRRDRMQQPAGPDRMRQEN